MKDWRGITVAVGDTVLYATRSSSWMGMTEGVVESIDDVNNDDSAAKVRIVRRQGGGTKELVTVSSRYLTVANLPTSAEPTMAEDNVEKAKRREALALERAMREAACGEHEWVNNYHYRMCKKCSKYEYGENYYPDGYMRRRW